jgi:hypothetical protein
MNVLGISPMPQPENLFTLETYKELIERLRQVRTEDNSLTYQNPDHRKRKDFLGEQRFNAIPQEYRARLPVYLLARCPFCGGRVWEAIDTFSLNGLGWMGAPVGFGWYGSRSYQADCAHVEIVAYGVNLNGLRPDDVFQGVPLGSEKPFVMTPVIELEQTYVVIHALPVGRYDDPEPLPRYTVYFTTYFTSNKTAFEAVVQPFHEDYSLVQYGVADYDLLKWVEAGKLFWLDPADPELPLRNQPVEAIPYGNVEGLEGLRVIRNGRLKLQIGRWGQVPRDQKEAEGGFVRQIINSFLRGWRGE